VHLEADDRGALVNVEDHLMSRSGAVTGQGISDLGGVRLGSDDQSASQLGAIGALASGRGSLHQLIEATINSPRPRDPGALALTAVENWSRQVDGN
jgi:hypothetical protein